MACSQRTRWAQGSHSLAACHEQQGQSGPEPWRRPCSRRRRRRRESAPAGTATGPSSIRTESRNPAAAPPHQSRRPRIRATRAPSGTNRITFDGQLHEAVVEPGRDAPAVQLPQRPRQVGSCAPVHGYGQRAIRPRTAHRRTVPTWPRGGVASGVPFQRSTFADSSAAAAAGSGKRRCAAGVPDPS